MTNPCLLDKKPKIPTWQRREMAEDCHFAKLAPPIKQIYHASNALMQQPWRRGMVLLLLSLLKTFRFLMKEERIFRRKEKKCWLGLLSKFLQRNEYNVDRAWEELPFEPFELFERHRCWETWQCESERFENVCVVPGQDTACRDTTRHWKWGLKFF